VQVDTSESVGVHARGASEEYPLSSLTPNVRQQTSCNKRQSRLPQESHRSHRGSRTQPPISLNMRVLICAYMCGSCEDNPSCR